MEKAKIVKFDSVSKRYSNNTIAVDNISFELGKGEVFGFLGPNGSGKTTTILMLLGLTDQSSGSINVLGYNPLRSPLEIKRKVAYLPDTVGFYEEMSVYGNIDYMGKLMGLEFNERKKRIDEVLSYLHLDVLKNNRVKTLSHGMKRRLGLAEVLLKKPSVVILDEPTQGLDPKSTVEFLKLVKEMQKKEAMSVIIASHHLSEVQYLCDRVALFRSGKLSAVGTVNELAQELNMGRFEIEIETDAKDVKSIFKNIEAIISLEDDTEGHVQLTALKDIRALIAKLLVENNIELYSLKLKESSLDDIYRLYYEKER